MPASNECARSLETLLDACKELGIPVAAHKCTGPQMHWPNNMPIVFLGIRIDTVSMEITLPEEKLDQVKSLLAAWKGSTRRELQPLIGHLAPTCCKSGASREKVYSGHAFVAPRTQKATPLHQAQRILLGGSALVADIRLIWNGVSILYRLNRQATDSEFHTNASGSWGCAALWEGYGFQLPWVSCPSFASASIAPKELLPVVLAASTWGNNYWSGKTILCHSDNEAVVNVINTGSCKESHLVHIMRYLFFIESTLNFTLTARHIPGKCNSDADTLSRDAMHSFLSSHPQANHLPTPLRPEPYIGDPRLDQIVRHFLHRALAPSTHRSVSPSIPESGWATRFDFGLIG